VARSPPAPYVSTVQYKGFKIEVRRDHLGRWQVRVTKEDGSPVVSPDEAAAEWISAAYNDQDHILGLVKEMIDRGGLR
jgi:hypothetical protein